MTDRRTIRLLLSMPMLIIGVTSCAQDLIRSWEMPSPAGVYGIQPADDGGAFISIHNSIATLARLNAEGDTVWAIRPMIVTHMGHNLHRHGDHLYLVGNIGAQNETNMRVVHKYTLDGELVWANGVTGNHDQTALTSRVLDDGSLLLCASIYTEPSGTTPYRPVLSKFSSEGSLLWSREHLLPTDATIYGIAVAQDGTIWSVGRNNGDGLLMHFDADGELLDTHRLLAGIPGGTVLLQHVAIKPDGNIQIWARVQGGPLGSVSWGTFILDANGVPQPWNFYGTDGVDLPNAWKQREDGSWLVLGNTNAQWVMISISADGEVEHGMTIGGPGNFNTGLALAADEEGHAWLGGSLGSTSPLASFARVTVAGSDLCNAAPITYQHLTGPIPSLVQDLAPISGPWGDPEAPMPFPPVPLIPFVAVDPCGSVSIPSKDKPLIRMWPNPAAEVLHFSEPLSGHVRDVQGRSVMELHRTSSLDLRMLAGGVYIVQAQEGSVMRFMKE